MRCLPKQTRCALCEDWSTGASFVGQDQLFQFTTQGVHPKLPAGLRVTSAAQWEKLQKRFGVTADLSLKERINRRGSGVALRAQQERRMRLKQRALPLVERAWRESHRIQVA